jgi:acyl-CoA synthetase (AMP-forming)/AMP-acid ligase II
VALLDWDPARFVLAACAVLWAGGAVVVPPRVRSWRAALGAVAALRPRGVIAGPVGCALAGVDPALRRAPVRLYALPRRVAGALGAGAVDQALGMAPLAPAAVASEDEALLSFTTGTTGFPKVVRRSHGVLLAQHGALAAVRRPVAGARDLVGLPLLILHNLGSGVTSVLPPRGGGGGALRGTVARLGVHSAAGFPSLFETLLEGAAEGELPALRAVQIGGAAPAPELLRRLHAVAPAADVTLVYGATEAEPIATCGADEYLAQYPDTAGGAGICLGRPVPGVEVRIGVGGNVLVRGGRVAGPENGWHDTGDVGRLDDDDRLWLLGRGAHAVSVPGGTLFPAEVEPAVAALPWVAGAVLAAVETSEGRRAALAVQPRRWGTRGERRAWEGEVAALSTGRGWTMERMALVRRLPRDWRSGSKIDYPRLVRLLRRRVAAGSAAGSAVTRRATDARPAAAAPGR